MIDRTSKILLGPIAAGLWLNFAERMIKPRVVSAQNLSSIERLVKSIEDNVDDIEDGTCSNRRICH